MKWVKKLTEVLLKRVEIVNEVYYDPVQGFYVGYKLLRKSNYPKV